MVSILSGRKTEYIRYMVNQHKCRLSQTCVIPAVPSHSVITFPVSHSHHHIPSITFPTLVGYLRRDNKRVVKKGKGLATEYLVKWKGYGPEFDRWCNVKTLDGARDQIESYEKALSAATVLTNPISSSPSTTSPAPPLPYA